MYINISMLFAWQRNTGVSKTYNGYHTKKHGNFVNFCGFFNHINSCIRMNRAFIGNSSNVYVSQKRIKVALTKLDSPASD